MSPVKNHALSASKGNQYDETVLVAVTGLSPAVLTETVWALAMENPPVIPNRVIVVTTLVGKSKIEEQLLKSGVWDALREEVGRKIKKPVDGLLRFGLTGDSIKVISAFSKEKELSDIRTDEDNWDAADSLMGMIRQFSETEDIRLIASIAGGRKTMGSLLVSVMTVLGRFDDRIVHVLVDEPWERIPGFYYPGCKGEFHDPVSKKKLSSAKARLQLTEVPFIPLRYLFQQEVRNAKSDYRRLVNQLRGQLSIKDARTQIDVDMQAGTVCVNQTVLPLTPFEFAFYAYFAIRAQEAMPPLVGLDDLGAYGEELYQLATECHSEDLKRDGWRNAVIKKIPAPDADSATKSKFDSDGSLYRKTANQIRTKMKNSGITSHMAGLLVPKRGRFSIDLPPQFISINRRQA